MIFRFECPAGHRLNWSRRRRGYVHYEPSERGCPESRVISIPVPIADTRPRRHVPPTVKSSPTERGPDNVVSISRYTCRFCERAVAVNPLTGNMRKHTVPAAYDGGTLAVIPGEYCPGTGSTPWKVASR